MKPLFLSALAIAMFLASPGVQAATCEVVDETFERKVADAPETREAFHNRLLREFRQLRKSALTLQRMGYEDSCQAVMAAIRDMRDNPKAARMYMIKNTPEEELDLNFYERQQIARSRAKPLTEVGGIHVADILGAEVYGTDGKSVGEIDDLIVAADEKKAFAIVGFGGFLGIGEEQAAVPLSKIRVAEDGDSVFIPATEKQIDRAPRFKTGDRDWLTNDAWLEKNFVFYDG